ncbi:MAG: hypothetical protein K1X94_19270 [Sandaracinaceae bacterium]|nr:hypothetical protein [Sandaracinaceae bacterium]
MSPPTQNDRPNPTTGPADREIHRLFDGDLTADERAALLASAARDPRISSGTRLKLEALGDLRALVRAATSDESEPVDADAAWAQIAARIEGAESAEVETRASAPKITMAASRPALRVIQGGLSESASKDASETRASEVERPAERAESAPPDLLQRIERATADRDDETKRRERQVRQRRSIIMVVSGLAAAAAAAIAYFGPGEDRPTPDPVVAVEDHGGTEDLAPIFDPVADEQLRRTEVISVDFGSNVGTVFSVEGTEGSRYAVVWLADEADKAAGSDDTSPDEAPSQDDPGQDSANL